MIFKTLIRKLVLLIKALFSIFCFVFPINKRKICFSSFYGKGYSGDPKYICEELLSKQYKIVWAVDSKTNKESFSKTISCCKANGFVWIFHKLTSSVWIDNCRTKMLFKRKKTLYINTWHGGSPQKKTEQDALNLSKGYVKVAKRDSKMVDYYCSSSQELSKLFKNSFWFSNSVLKFMSPRNEYLIKNAENKILKARIKERISIDKDSILVFYCPTFRNDGNIDVYKFDYQVIVESLEKVLNKKVLFLLRLHPNLKANPYFSSLKNVIDVTNYNEVQELLLISDYLISDYSSVLYDFIHTLKPSVSYAPDLELYNDERGLYHPLSFFPWPTVSSEKELTQLLLNYDYAGYSNRVSDFKKKVGIYECKNSAASIADLINRFIESKLNKKYLAEYVKDYVA